MLLNYLNRRRRSLYKIFLVVSIIFLTIVWILNRKDLDLNSSKQDIDFQESFLKEGILKPDLRKNHIVGSQINQNRRWTFLGPGAAKGTFMTEGFIIYSNYFFNIRGSRSW